MSEKVDSGEDQFEAFCRIVGAVERPSDEQKERGQAFWALKRSLDELQVSDEQAAAISEGSDGYRTDPNNADYLIYDDSDSFVDNEEDLDYVE